MTNSSPMQKALGNQWQKLPPALQLHHQSDANSDVGHLDIEYPRFMHPYITFLHLLGALINQCGGNFSTNVEKHMRGNIQYWKRTVCLSKNKKSVFNSFWIFGRKNELIEFINPFHCCPVNLILFWCSWRNTGETE